MGEIVGYDYDKLLEKFMKEFFPFKELVKLGFFTKEMKGNYKAQSEKVCTFFGYKTVYEYGTNEFSYHASYVDKNKEDKPFIEVVNNIYE